VDRAGEDAGSVVSSESDAASAKGSRVTPVGGSEVGKEEVGSVGGREGGSYLGTDDEIAAAAEAVEIAYSSSPMAHAVKQEVPLFDAEDSEEGDDNTLRVMIKERGVWYEGKVHRTTVIMEDGRLRRYITCLPL
jgi:hypothetical protein